jgi:hypothetical protein
VESILIPTMLFWENGNTWYGSLGNARFFLQPVKHQPEEGAPETQPSATIEAELWKGPLTKSLSEILATASFPLTEEGLSQTVRWLEEQAAALNS